MDILFRFQNTPPFSLFILFIYYWIANVCIKKGQELRSPLKNTIFNNGEEITLEQEAEKASMAINKAKPKQSFRRAAG